MAASRNNHYRSNQDRRSGDDRRRAYSIDYFRNGGVERRDYKAGDRRGRTKERRRGWIQITRWSSMFMDR